MNDVDFILRIAMLNSYDIIIGNATADEVMETDLNYMIFNPYEPITEDHKNKLIEYFTDTEEYELCQELTKIKI